MGYAAWPYEPGRVALVEEHERRSALRRLWVAGLGMMQVMMYAVPAYVAGAGEMTPDIGLMRWSGLVLTIPVVAYSAAPFFRGAWRDLRLARLGMDVPIVLGIAVALVASVWATAAGSGAVYFDSIAMFVFLLLAGRYLELLARSRAFRGAPLPVVRQLLRGVPRQRDREARAGQLLRDQLRLLQGLWHVRGGVPVRRHRDEARDDLRGKAWPDRRHFDEYQSRLCHNLQTAGVKQ